MYLRIKKQKVITPFVICAFLFMVIASSQPIGATDNVKLTAATEEDHPGAIEETAPYAKKKSSPLIPIVIGLVVIGGVAAVLFLVVLKNKYDITGMWDVSFTWSGQSTGHKVFTFSGTKKSGNFSYDGEVKGTYSVDGKNVQWVFPSGTRYTGTFSDKNIMSGTMVSSSGTPGTWSASKLGGATVIPVPKASAIDPEGNKVNK